MSTGQLLPRIWISKKMSSTPRTSPLALHVPAWTGNPYLRLLTRAIDKRGWNTEIIDFLEENPTLVELTRRGFDEQVIHMHWPNPYFAKFFWSASAFSNLVKPSLISIDTLQTRRRGARIVWTIHNEVSHETPDQKKERRLVRKLASGVDHLIFHSENARFRFSELHGPKFLAKSSVVPHGNYQGVYPATSIANSRYKSALLPSRCLTTYLMFGAIREYKGIPKVVESFRKNNNPNTRLLIVGKPYEDSLSAQLHDVVAADARICLIAEHIPDNEVTPIFNAADAIVFGFERTFSSGSLALALTMGKAIITTHSAKVLGMVNNESSKMYSSDPELTEIFESSTKEEFSALAKNSREISDTLSWDRLSAKIVTIYENVVGR